MTRGELCPILCSLPQPGCHQAGDPVDQLWGPGSLQKAGTWHCCGSIAITCSWEGVSPIPVPTFADEADEHIHGPGLAGRLQGGVQDLSGLAD